MRASRQSAVLVLVALTPVLTHAQAVPKIGTCPTDYHASGGACLSNFPSKMPPPALPKFGPCPVGYRHSGDYCLGYDDAKHAIPKIGSCPNGYHVSGAYCLAK